MEFVQTVREAAQGLGLLQADGTLDHLDSLTILDLVTRLEELTKISIPTVAITPDRFESIETVAQLLCDMRSA